MWRSARRRAKQTLVARNAGEGCFGVSLLSVRRILEAHQPAPHLQVSNDPLFAEKLKDIVGRYVDPPEHALVLAVDEKSRIRAVDRPSLPFFRRTA
jgi:hypothetical protein